MTSTLPQEPRVVDLLWSLEQLLKNEPCKPIRDAAKRLFIELTEPRKEAA